MAAASHPRSSRNGARDYSQSGDIDQLLDDVWVPDNRFNAPSNSSTSRQPLQQQHQRSPQLQSPATEKEQLLMAQLEDAQRQLRELGRLRWAGSGGSGSSDVPMSSPGWGSGGDYPPAGRQQQRPLREDQHRQPATSWNGGARGGAGDRSSDSYTDDDDDEDEDDETRYSGSPEPLYVNTEMLASTAAAATAATAAAKRVPTPPPRTRLPSQPSQPAGSPAKQPVRSSALQPGRSSALQPGRSSALQPGRSSALQPAPADSPAVLAAATMRSSASAEQSESRHRHEKESASKREESVEVEESVSIFQVFPPTDQQPPQSGQQRTPPTIDSVSPRNGRQLNDLPSTNSPGGGVFRFPSNGSQPPPPQQQQQLQPQPPPYSQPQRQYNQPSSAVSASYQHQHQHEESFSSSIKQAQHYHSHVQPPPQHQHQLLPHQYPAVSHRSETLPRSAIGQQAAVRQESNRSQFQQQQQQQHAQSHSHSQQAGVIQASNSSSSSSCQHSSHQVKEAASSSRQEKQDVSDIYSETTSLRPIGQGIKTLPSHTAQHRLRQASSGYQLGNNRLQTLNLSTPQLDQPGPFQTVSQPQKSVPVASPVSTGVGPLRGSTPHVPVAAATTSAPVQVLPMAFMVAMPTASLSLQQLNGFGAASACFQVPPVAGGATPIVQQPLMPPGQDRSQHRSRSQHTHHQHQQQNQRQQRQFQSSRSLSRSDRIPSQAGSIRAGSFRVSSASASATRTASGLLHPPRVVVDTASSSSSSTVHADFDGESKTYVEVTDIRPVLITGAGGFQQGRSRSLGRGACSMSSFDADDAVFSNAAYATATLQASAIEPRNSFLQASSSSQNHQQHQPQQPQQQQFQRQPQRQTGGYTETVTSRHQSSHMQWQSSGGGAGWLASPGSNSPSRRYSGHSASAGSSFDFDPPSPGGMLKFVNDTSQYWYLPNISREEAIALLKPLPPGRFVVRDSTSFAGAYGLAVKVAEVPPGAPPAETPASSSGDELVRHFLIERTSQGVRIRGCANEPVFASLAALIYQHTVMPLALPCRLELPPADAQNDAPDSADNSLDPRVILEHGAACSVLYLGAVDIESLSGSGGLSRGVDALLRHRDRLRTCVCQLKVARDGISLTDSSRRQFFRKHYPTACVLHCGMVPGGRSFDSEETRARGLNHPKMFGFVARKNATSQENTAVILCEIEEHQPAEAVVRFVCKYLIGR